MQTTWDLTGFGISTDKDSITKHLASLEKKIKLFCEKYISHMAEKSPAEWVIFLHEQEEVTRLVYQIAHPVSLMSTQDANDTALQSLSALVDANLSRISTITIPLDKEIKDLGSAKLISLSNNVLLEAYQNYFVQLASSVEFSLSTPEETLSALKSISLSSNYNQLLDTLSGIKTFEVEGKQLTEGVIRSWRSNPNPLKRQQASELLRDYYSTPSQQITRGAIYYGIVSDWVNDSKYRGYASSISRQNLSEEMKDSDVDILLSGVSDHYYMYHEFLQVKAQYLGKTKLDYHDVWAPFSESETKLDWDLGSNTAKQYLSTIDPSISEYIDMLLNSGKIDVFPKPGKQGGAFASYNKFYGEYIKLNYVDDLDSVITYAHELGHAFHGHISKYQPNVVYSTPLVLAETASTFFQIHAMKCMIRDKPELALSLQAELLEDFYATVMRQVQYVKFEKKVHQLVWEGGVFDYSTCNMLWGAEVKELLGSSVVESSEFTQYGWSAIPHIFHTPFYCYSYAYGMLFALALYKSYTLSGSSDTLLTILKLGGSKTPAQMLKIAGIDSIESMITMGMEELASWQTNLKTLLATTNN